MEDLIIFFRDTLSGTTYIIVVVIAIILILACIGYLAEKSLNKKKNDAKYAAVDIDETPTTQTIPSVESPSVLPTPEVVAASVTNMPEVSKMESVSGASNNTNLSPVAELTPNVASSPIPDVVDVNNNNSLQ